MGCTMTSCKPHVGDIWLAYVEFIDHPGVGKVRPVLVIDVHDDACVALAAKITSKDLAARGEGKCIPIPNWADHGLRKPSYVRVDQRLELAYENLLREAPIGRVSDTFLDSVVDAIVQLLR